MMLPKLSIIISAPSGAGKSTVVAALLKQLPQLAFSVSACSRSPRKNERDGVHYYFLDQDSFKHRIDEGEFFEWEEVYPGMYYGTLQSELERIWAEGKVVVFDVDVFGALQIKSKLGTEALSIFIQPPNLDSLEERLRNRQTDNEQKIQLRLAKAAQEMEQASKFDKIVINDDLNEAIERVKSLILDFIQR